MILPILLGRITVVLTSISISYYSGVDFSLNSNSLIYSTLFIIYDNVITVIIIGYLAFLIAPKAKFIASIVQVIIWCLYTTVILGMYISYANLYQSDSYLYSFEAIQLYLSFAAMIITAIIISIYIFREEKEQKEFEVLKK